ncbi:Subtilisin-like protease 3 [Cercospora beticola]|uniref:Subtilisin-like protease 3 n=1 Tax=Cercospora beticola TaxID=122368 RepID=A0A2G5H9T7_CERBT|nr:Subtilisin-like protease 3 [Cercospora beticola]PIA89053.1 Subtilisin-like protease 3 [Cercospora beticola]WPB03219.1 hypothetical protein RHO25_007856 [Cercospora beticola]CAK1358060.1 unnamed protein product [Cercospora beticola]
MFKTLSLLLCASAACAKPTILKRQDVAGEVVPDKYIVQLAPNAVLDDKLIQKLKDESGIKVNKTTSFNLDGLKGFTVKANDSAIDSLAEYSSLISVEPVTVIRAAIIPRQATAGTLVAKDGTWGLDRISHRSWTYTSRDFPENKTEYIYKSVAGVNTVTYVVDTGIYTAHSDFGGRASYGANFITNEGPEDKNGHGTHVAGTIGGTKFGVARRGKLVSVKVLNVNGTGDLSGIISALDWINKDVAANKASRRGSVVNMSIGASFSQTLNDATNALANAGILVVVAAGNSAVDASTQSPASATGACTIGSMSYYNSANTYSNFGPKVALHAPGFRVRSAGIAGPNAVAELSGTSMASPHVAGVGAYLMSVSTSYTGSNLCKRMQQFATRNQLKKDDGTALGNNTPNLIVWNTATKPR